MTDLSTLDQLLDRPVAYHPVFADLTGSVEAAVMLRSSGGFFALLRIMKFFYLSFR